MTERFFTSPSGGYASVEGGDPTFVPAGMTETDEATYTAAVAAAEAAQQSSQDAANALREADAQTVYDEMLTNHPGSALILARLVFGGFEP